MEIEDEDFRGAASGLNAVNRLAEIQIARLTQKEKTKRILIIGVLVLVVFATVILVFAPNGRETVSYIIGTILIILALGVIGASKFILQVPGIKVDTSNNRQPADREISGWDGGCEEEAEEV